MTGPDAAECSGDAVDRRFGQHRIIEALWADIGVAGMGAGRPPRDGLGVFTEGSGRMAGGQLQEASSRISTGMVTPGFRISGTSGRPCPKGLGMRAGLVHCARTPGRPPDARAQWTQQMQSLTIPSVVSMCISFLLFR